MTWSLVPAIAAAALMTLFGIGAMMRPTTLKAVGVSADSPLGTSEIRAVFGGMFVALGVACLITREPLVFAVVGSAWLADLGVPPRCSSTACPPGRRSPFSAPRR